MPNNKDEKINLDDTIEVTKKTNLEKPRESILEVGSKTEKAAKLAVTELENETTEVVEKYPQTHKGQSLPEKTIGEMELMAPAAVDAEQTLEKEIDEIVKSSKDSKVETTSETFKQQKDIENRERLEHFHEINDLLTEFYKVHHEYRKAYVTEPEDKKTENLKEQCEEYANKFAQEKQFLADALSSEDFNSAASIVYILSRLEWDHAYGGEYAESIFKTAGSLIEGQIPHIKKIIKDNEEAHLSSAFDMAKDLIKVGDFLGNNDWQNAGVAIFEESIDIVKEKIQGAIDKSSKDEEPWSYSDALLPMMKFCSPEVGKQAAEIAAKLFRYPERNPGQYNANTIFKFILDKEKGIFLTTLERKLNRTPQEQHFLEQILTGYGLEPQEFFEAWAATGTVTKSSVKTVEMFKQNFEAIRDIELKRNGAIKTLNKDFGLFDFNRYPLEMMVDQYDQREDTESEWYSFVSTLGDYNGAQSNHEMKRVIKSFYEQCKDKEKKQDKTQSDKKYPIRAIELGDTIRAGALLGEIKDKYSQPEVNLISSHGSEEGIQLTAGRYSKKKRGYFEFTKSDIDRRRFKELDFFKSGSINILLACNTGAENGIGQKLSEASHSKVKGPSTPTSHEVVNPIFKNGKIVDIEVSYKDGETSEKVSTMTYINGELVKE